MEGTMSDNRKPARMPAGSQFKKGDPRTVEMGRKGGLAFGRKFRETEALAATIRRLMADEDAEGATRQQRIIANLLRMLEQDGKWADLKIVAELIGELKQTIEVKAPTIAVRDNEAAEEVRQMMDLGNEE